jgi:nucleoside-diphosphate-sugar epimerase
MLLLLIIGISGNTAQHVVQRLHQRQPELAIVGTTRRRMTIPGVHHIEQVSDYREETLMAIFAKYPIQTVVQAAHTTLSPVVMKVADRFAVKHVVLVHTSGIFSKIRSCREQYVQIEEQILTAGHTTPFTILRPTLIYGTPEDRNMARLIQFVRKQRLIPMIGFGQNLFQPVHVDDLASAIVAALGQPTAYGKAYTISGGTVLTYREIVMTIARELRKRIVLVPIPYSLALSAVWLLNHLLRRHDLTVEQVQRMREDKDYSYADAANELGYAPRSFSDGIASEIRLILAREMG